MGLACCPPYRPGQGNACNCPQGHIGEVGRSRTATVRSSVNSGEPHQIVAKGLCRPGCRTVHRKYARIHVAERRNVDQRVTGAATVTIQHILADGLNPVGKLADIPDKFFGLKYILEIVAETPGRDLYAIASSPLGSSCGIDHGASTPQLLRFELATAFAFNITHNASFAMSRILQVGSKPQ